MNKINTEYSFLVIILVVHLFLKHKALHGTLRTHHHCLLHQSVTVLTHVFQNLVCSVVASSGCRFRGHSQRIDQSLQRTSTSNILEPHRRAT